MRERARPTGRPSMRERLSNQVSNYRHYQRWTPADAGGQSIPGQAGRSAGSQRRYLASGRRGRVYRADCRIAPYLRSRRRRWPGSCAGLSLWEARPARAWPLAGRPDKSARAAGTAGTAGTGRIVVKGTPEACRCAIPPGLWTTTLVEDARGACRWDGQDRALFPARSHVV